MTNDAFIDIFGMGLDSTAIAMVEFQLRAISDMGDQLAIRLRSMRSSNDLFTRWTDRHGSFARESTDGDLGDHGDQLETNQRSISVLEDLSALHGAPWRSVRAPQIAAWWNGGISMSLFAISTESAYSFNNADQVP